jgi:GNAT superfamily N-acetyltransferase
MSAVTLRRARPADRDAALALWAALHREHEALDARYRLAPDAPLRWARDLDEWMGVEHRLVLLAEASGGAVGLLVAQLAWPAPVYAPSLLAHVDDLYVVPPWRGRGVGKMLLEESERWARRHGATSLQAGVLAANDEGLAFWDQAGTRPYQIVVTKLLD